MKELITTQLIEEYQKVLNRTISAIDILQAEGKEVDEHKKLSTQRNMLIDFIRSLQSKQSEERQNIVDAARHDDLKLNGEDYFNQTFKQKQK